jgi:hypothetical protein
MTALTVSWRIEAASPLRAPDTQVALIDRASRSASLTALLFEPVAGWLRMPRPRPRSEILSALRANAEPSHDRGILVLPSLPAGHYRLHAGKDAGHLEIIVGRTGSPAFTFDLNSDPHSNGDRRVDIVLPTPVTRLLVRTVTQPIERVALEPLAIARALASDTRPADFAVAYGDVVAFFPGEGAFPESGGFWVRPGDEVAVVILQPDATRGLEVHVRNAPTSNRVTLRVGESRQEWDLDAGAERTATVPAPGPSHISVLRIRAERGVRPADREPGNRDMRLLGVWVSLVRT